MFAIVISEKGGTERREVFDKDEINVGRVQGNDVLLPKGNVSKRHARLTYRDGRFIVTDLKSTNGTYVNGHRIAQATIIREGDKIYVGDFVIRLEAVAPGTAVPSPPRVPSLTGDPSSSGRDSLGSFNEVEHTLSRQVGLPLSTSESLAPPTAAVGGPSNDATPRPIPPPRPSLPTPPPLATARESYEAGPSLSPAPGSANGPSSHGNRGTSLYRDALALLLEQVQELVDLGPIEDGRPIDDMLGARIDRALREQIGQLRSDGELAAGIDDDALMRDARAELCGLGPLAPLLEDPEVAEVHVPRFDRVIAIRAGESKPIEPPFSSEATLRRAVARLCREAGQPLIAGEAVANRSWGAGLSLQVVFPPVAVRGCALTFRRPRTVEATLDELVRAGMLSRTMAVFLTNAVQARSSVLVAAPPGAASASFLAALAAAGSSDGRSAVLSAAGESGAGTGAGVWLQLPDWGTRGAEVARVAAALRADRLLVNPFVGEVAAAILGVAAGSGASVVGFVPALSLRHALDRLAADLAAGRPGMSNGAARSWIAASFDVLIEVARLRDGRHRVLRIAETAGGLEGDAAAGRDVFTFSVERTAAGGAVEGTFAATGLIPRVVEEQAARGHSIDTSLFRRPTR